MGALYNLCYRNCIISCFSVSSRSFDLKEALNAIGVQICSIVNKSLSERGLPTLSEEMQSNLMGQIAHVVEKNNPVCSLIG